MEKEIKFKDLNFGYKALILFCIIFVFILLIEIFSTPFVHCVIPGKGNETAHAGLITQLLGGC